MKKFFVFFIVFFSLSSFSAESVRCEFFNDGNFDRRSLRDAFDIKIEEILPIREVIPREIIDGKARLTARAYRYPNRRDVAVEFKVWTYEETATQDEYMRPTEVREVVVDFSEKSISEIGELEFVLKTRRIDFDDYTLRCSFY